MALGQQRFGQRCLDEAIGAFRLATSLEPRRAEGWTNLGVACVEKGDWIAGLQALDKALVFNPTLAPAHLGRGDALRGLGRTKEAIQSYRTAVALQASAHALNKLGCALRVLRNFEEAERCYRNALDLVPDFSLAKVNMATLQVDLGHFDRAELMLQSLSVSNLASPERQEVSSALTALHEHARLVHAIERVVQHEHALVSLRHLLRDTPDHLLEVDQACLKHLMAMAESVRNYCDPGPKPCEAFHLDPRWPVLEAHFCLHLGDTEDSYRQTVRGQTLSVEGNNNLETLKVSQVAAFARAVVIARRSYEEEGLSEPIGGELCIRHYHALITQNQSGFLPGQFKLLPNQIANNPAFPLVHPLAVTGTLRRFFTDVYSNAEPGIARGALINYALTRIHPFVDGNGRLGRFLLNRELDTAGHAPLLVPGRLRDALIQAEREAEARCTLMPILEVLYKAREFTREFCIAVADAY
jgi:tetratricopeptide (TPR) repeat protein